MSSLWTDDDRGAHPWIVGRPPAGAPGPAKVAQDEPADEHFSGRGVVVVACVAAAVAVALLQVLL